MSVFIVLVAPEYITMKKVFKKKIKERRKKGQQTGYLLDSHRTGASKWMESSSPF